MISAVPKLRSSSSDAIQMAAAPRSIGRHVAMMSESESKQQQHTHHHNASILPENDGEKRRISAAIMPNHGKISENEHHQQSSTGTGTGTGHVNAASSSSSSSSSRTCSGSANKSSRSSSARELAALRRSGYRQRMRRRAETSGTISDFADE